MDTDIQVMIVLSDMNSESVHPILYTPKVTKEEIVMLKCVNMKSEGECEGTDTEGMFECVCHFLGNPAYYIDQPTFNEWMNCAPEDGYPVASALARSTLTWENYGRWRDSCLSTIPRENQETRFDISINSDNIFFISIQ